MFRRATFVLTVAAMLLLGAGIARADDPYRIVVSRVDPSDFPTVRLVAAVVDANGKAVPGLRPQDLEVRELTDAAQSNRAAGRPEVPRPDDGDGLEMDEQ